MYRACVTRTRKCNSVVVIVDVHPPPFLFVLLGGKKKVIRLFSGASFRHQIRSFGK